MKPWNKGKKFSEESRKKMSENNYNKKHPGEKNCNWKGGLTTQNTKLRRCEEYRFWRKSVLERDNFVCQKYGTSGGCLHAHHINNFSEFPELRYSIDNGITLSVKAHKEFHKLYGRKNNTYEQLEDFLTNN